MGSCLAPPDSSFLRFRVEVFCLRRQGFRCRVGSSGSGVSPSRARPVAEADHTSARSRGSALNLLHILWHSRTRRSALLPCLWRRTPQRNWGTCRLCSDCYFSHQSVDVIERVDKRPPNKGLQLAAACLGCQPWPHDRRLKRGSPAVDTYWQTRDRSRAPYPLGRQMILWQ